MTGTLLALEEVDAGYGPFRALFGVSFEVAAGSAVALLGANGAGKTTVARVCSGLVRPTAGAVRFAGEDVTGAKPYEIARLGVAHAPEGRSVFATLSVEENLTLSFRQLLGLRSREQRPGEQGSGEQGSGEQGSGEQGSVADALERAYDAFPRLRERRGQVAGTLSGGEQRMLSLARVLADPPRLLIADELSLGLAPIVVEEVYRTLERIRDRGTALLVVEQQVGHALALADRAVVLSQGRVAFEGPADELGGLEEELVLGADATG